MLTIHETRCIYGPFVLRSIVKVHIASTVEGSSEASSLNALLKSTALHFPVQSVGERRFPSASVGELGESYTECSGETASMNFK